MLLSLLIHMAQHKRKLQSLHTARHLLSESRSRVKNWVAMLDDLPNL